LWNASGIGGVTFLGKLIHKGEPQMSASMFRTTSFRMTVAFATAEFRASPAVIRNPATPETGPLPYAAHEPALFEAAQSW